ncbi:MAG: hypothetical protein HXK79_09820 [Lachnospiraceae bacterium]|nr:hypothetical protein [Lachnospiraceae bacterium]
MSLKKSVYSLQDPDSLEETTMMMTTMRRMKMRSLHSLKKRRKQLLQRITARLYLLKRAEKAELKSV